MGASSYSSSVFDTTYSKKTAGGASFFGHTAAINSGTTTAKVHEKLDPSVKNSAGLLIRESRDSATHPDSVAISVLFDVTGSLQQVPKVFVTKLGNLMSLLTKKGYLADPHIQFGAIGDAYADRAPLQIGQFESGNEMDDVLSLIYLESGGGGQTMESYELALYYMARHTNIDCFEKRGKKGYLFMLGDELPYKHVNKDQVKRIIGDTLEKDIPIEVILEEVREKYELFFIMPKGTSYWDSDHVNSGLKAIFDQSFLKLENPEDVSELIATTIGIGEGFDVLSIENDLVSMGSTKKAAKNASTALAPYIAGSAAIMRKTATVTGSLAKSSKKPAKRL